MRDSTEQIDRVLTSTPSNRKLKKSPIDIKLRLCCTAVCCIFGVGFLLTAVFIWIGIVKGFISTENDVSPQLVPLVAIGLAVFGVFIPCIGILVCIAIPRVFQTKQAHRSERYHQFGEADEEDAEETSDPVESQPRPSNESETISISVQGDKKQ
jgi:hypothetical protein